jgi:hypothetical protein
MTATKRYTLSDIRRINKANGWYFFSRDTMRHFGDTMKSFGVRHIDGRVILYRKRNPRYLAIVHAWEFCPLNGNLAGLMEDDPVWPRLNID